MNDRQRDFSEYVDELGLAGPLPATDGQRRMPEEGFSCGPEVGEPLPGFQLRDQHGRLVDLHEDRDGAKAAVVFFRSAVW